MTEIDMKGCFVLQRRFAYIGHELVRHLIEKGVIQDACAYVQTRDSFEFLTEQSDMKYSALLFDEDIHEEHRTEKLDMDFLRDLEAKYGQPTLWRYLNVDRIVRFRQLVREYPYDTPSYSHEDMLRILQVQAKRISAFLAKEKPDFLVTTQPGAIGTVLLYHMARVHGIRTLVIILPGLETLTSLSERYDRLTFVEETAARYRGLQNDDIPEWGAAKEAIRSFRAKPRAYSQVYDAVPSADRSAHFRFLMPRGFLESIRWFVRMCLQWLRDPRRRRDYTTINPWVYILDRIKRKGRILIGYDDFYSPFQKDIPFAFFPLHLEPEVALTLLAPFASEQLPVIRQVAQSLPVGYKLVVKEHPVMVGFRPRSFYRELKKIPNLILVHPRIKATDILPHARLVTTISGTAGFEAVLLKKPVITFGEVFYNALSFVRHSEVPAELPALVASQLSDFRFDEDELIRFVAAILKESVSVDLAYIWTLENDTLKKRQGLTGLADLIAEKVRD